MTATTIKQKKKLRATGPLSVGVHKIDSRHAYVRVRGPARGRTASSRQPTRLPLSPPLPPYIMATGYSVRSGSLSCQPELKVVAYRRTRR